MMCYDAFDTSFSQKDCKSTIFKLNMTNLEKKDIP